MTLLEEIKAKCPPELLANRDDGAIAALVSDGRTRIASRQIGIGTVLATVPDGGKFLDTLVAIGTQNRDVYWAMELVKAGTFDIGMDASRRQMEGLAKAVPDLSAGIALLLALAEMDAPVSAQEIAQALEAS